MKPRLALNCCLCLASAGMAGAPAAVALASLVDRSALALVLQVPCLYITMLRWSLSKFTNLNLYVGPCSALLSDSS